MQNMYYIGLDVHKRTISYCVKDGGGKIHAEGRKPTPSILCGSPPRAATANGSTRWRPCYEVNERRRRRCVRMNIQPDVIHILHGGASFGVSESALSLSSASVHQALLLRPMHSN